MPVLTRNTSLHTIVHELRPDNLLYRIGILHPFDQGGQDVKRTLEGDTC